ncbi:MAG: hypothetical protein J6P13_02030 [Kiritimatiellae bacterium]|nr:hypothetical protein [Kiritimatiellia bacterium]
MAMPQRDDTIEAIKRLMTHDATKDLDSWNKAVLFLADAHAFNKDVISGLELLAIQATKECEKAGQDLLRIVGVPAVSREDVQVIADLLCNNSLISGHVSTVRVSKAVCADNWEWERGSHPACFHDDRGLIYG